MTAGLSSKKDLLMPRSLIGQCWTPVGPLPCFVAEKTARFPSFTLLLTCCLPLFLFYHLREPPERFACLGDQDRFLNSSASSAKQWRKLGKFLL